MKQVIHVSELALMVMFLGGLGLASCGPKLEPGESESAPSSTSQSSGSTGTGTGSAATGSSTGSGTTSSGSGAVLCNTNATSITYSAHASTVLNAKCTLCHSQSGSHPNPDLTTYASAKDGVKNGGLVEVDSGEMPPSSSKNGSLTADEKCIIDAWAKGGYLQ